MNQTKYRNWVRTSFISSVRAVLAPNEQLNTRQIVKRVRLQAAGDHLAVSGVRELITSAQTEYRKMLRHNYFFYEFGDRFTRALNAAVRLGVIKRELSKTIDTCQFSYVTNSNVKRHIYKYSLA